MMKKLIAFMLSLMIVVTGSTALAAGENGTYTIQEAQKTAIDNNLELKLDDADITSKETALADVQDDARTLGDVYGNSLVLNNRLIKEVRPLEATANLENAKRVKADHIRKIRQDIYKTANTLFLLNKELEKEQQKLQIITDRLEMAKTQYRLGKISETDLIDSEYNLDNKKNEIASLEARIKSTFRNLKKLMGLSLDDTAITIKGELTLSLLADVNLDDTIMKALESDAAIMLKAETLKAKQKTMELTAQLYKKGDSTYDDNTFSLESARMDYEDAKIKLEVDILNKYNDLLGKKDKVQLADRYEKLMDKKYKSFEVKFKHGMISKEQLLGQKERCLDAMYQKFAAIVDYNAAKADFEYLIGK